jgi:hypothetical protein
MRIHDKEPKLFTKILKAKAKRAARLFPLLPPLQKIFLQKKTKITKGWNNSAIISHLPYSKIES